MPCLVIDTNVPKSTVPTDFLKEMSKLVADSVGKPETYVCVRVNPDQMMTWGGTSEACALCSFGCVGKLGVEENKKLTAIFMDKINTDLAIPKDRMYINFTDLKRSEVGWSGKTFAT